MVRIWAAVIINGGVTGRQAEEFLQRFVGGAKAIEFEITRPNRYDVWNDPTTDEVIRNRIDLYRQNGCQHVMFFADGKVASTNALNRYLAEIEAQLQAHAGFDMTTQCVTKRTVEQVLRGDDAILKPVVQELVAHF